MTRVIRNIRRKTLKRERLFPGSDGNNNIVHSLISLKYNSPVLELKRYAVKRRA